MKKKICFLLTLVISLFVFSGRVEAAKELTCIYEDTALISPEHYMLVQNSAGELFAYYNHAGDLSMNDPNWVNRVDYGNIVKFDFTETNKDNDGVLSGCPKYSQGYKFKWNGDLNTHVYTFYFSDDKHYFKDDHEGTQYDYLPELDVYISFYMDKKAEYQKSIDEMINSGD